MNKNNLLFTLILLTLFSGTSILAIVTAKRATHTHINSANNPDFFMVNAVYTKFDNNGYIRNKFSTSKIIHFTKNNVFLFDNPNITIYNLKEEPWQITAQKGKSEKGKDKVYLWNQVKINRAASINNSDFDIATDAITVYPNNKFAKTKHPITIMQSGNLTKAVGAEANFKAGTIKLLAKIEGIYKTK